MAQPTSRVASAEGCAIQARHPAEKLLFSAGFLAIVFLLPPLPWSVVVLVLVSLTTLLVAKVPLGSWLRFLRAPVAFLALSSVGLLLELDVNEGELALRFSAVGVGLVRDLLLRSLAAVCTLAYLALTTPALELVNLLRRLGLPAEMVELAALLHRFLLMLLRTLQEMRLAQAWRMGQSTWRMRLRASAMLASALFVRSMVRAQRLEEGLANRGYRGELCLLPRHAAISMPMMGMIVTGQVLLVCVALAVEWGR